MKPVDVDECVCRNEVCITVSEPSPEAATLSAPKLCTLDLPDTGVCITVTEPSPENPAPRPPPLPPPQPAHMRRAAFRRMSEAPTVVQALVHRESEEYQEENS